MQNNSATRQIEFADAEREQFLADVLTGLSAERKTLNPKYFYDEIGSRLFEQITELPEYYITRTETGMMRKIASEIGDHCVDVRSVVEFGSGSGRRTDILLSALPRVAHYIPIDVSEEMLASTAKVVESSYPHIRVHPQVADFTTKLQQVPETPGHQLGFFPGSTIGNFLYADAISFLEDARELLGANAKMLIGVDLAKSADTLEQAYDDSAGVTAQFNKNILTRINNELGANFKLNEYAHKAIFDRDRSRIEMHLVSLADQQILIDGMYTINMRTGETIHTENSHKFTIDGFCRMADRAGWRSATRWVDSDHLFSVHLLETD